MALLAALAAHMGASFTYHSAYDDVLIAFLLIALGARAFGREGTMWWKAGWLLC
jgi:hypothetical protein